MHLGVGLGSILVLFLVALVGLIPLKSMIDAYILKVAQKLFLY